MRYIRSNPKHKIIREKYYGYEYVNNNKWNDEEDEEKEKTAVSMLKNKNTVKKYFPSNHVGHLIVNAVTGEKYNIKVGSKDSLRLFKVTDTTGLYSARGHKNNIYDRSYDISKEPNYYYFDNPSEYLQNMGERRIPELLDRWRNYQDSLVDSAGKVNLDFYKNNRFIL